MTLAIAKNELLNGFEPGWIAWFQERCIEIAFSQGDLMIEQGSSAIGLYLLLEGEVSVQTDRGDELAKVGSGSVIGEMALVDGGLRSVNVIATTDVSSYLLTASEFEAIKRARPEIALAVMTNLCKIISSRVRSLHRLVV